MSFDERVKAHYATVAEWADTYKEHGLGLMEWLVERVKRLETERDRWRQQALEENTRADAMVDGLNLPPIEWCRECQETGEQTRCPYFGEPNGCNNAAARSRLAEHENRKDNANG